jgi:hypothetical protein
MPTQFSKNPLILELPDAADELLINAGIAADPDTFEVSEAQFRKMRIKTNSFNERVIIADEKTNEPDA